ncbi:hypothetical protein GJR96_16165 [Haloferax sp. MBLA0076]|uniref:DUF7827 domain-containing protein n=1 Tax=Haloferax litoreum TaxID=2666140 RepID=A0A6A8GK57_9EURY|nr:MULTISPECIES: BGTF surface domain-containing protein [Haloferax]KAB1190505.1 hypothetical protein Hfx1148_16110 [Haloferax sp. CBA1148]MRX23485.1 hypothetical protein [Haloferax litoreum]
MTRRIFVVGAAVLAVTLVVSSIVAPVAAADDEPTFAKNITTVQSGETVNVTVLTPGDDSATAVVTVGSNESGFVARASVVDTNGDGRVSLLMNTSEAGTGDASSYLSVPEGDELRSAEQVTSNLSDSIDPGAYDLAVGPSDEPTDIGTLVVESQRVDEQTTTAEAPSLPGDAADSDSITVVPSEDRIVVDPEAEQTIRGETTFEAGTNLSFRVKAVTGRKYLQARQVSVNESGEFNATLDFSVADPGSTFELVVVGPGETRESVPGRVNGSWVPPEDGTDGDTDSEDDTETDDYPLPADGDDSDAITVLPTEDNFSLESATGRVVHGETSLEPGTELTIRIRSIEGRNFIKSADTEVGEFGTFSTRFDFDGVPSGTTFVLRIAGPNGTVEEVPGRVVDCESDCTVPETTVFPVDGFGVVAVTETSQTAEARIPIRLDERTEATLVVGGDSVNYRTGMTVRDGNGDGRILVVFDSAAAGDEAPTLRVVSRGDSGERAIEETDLPRLIDAGSYPLTLYAGTDTTKNPIDTGELVIGKASNDVGTDSDRTTAESTPALDPDSSVSPVDGRIDARLFSIGGLAIGGVLAVLGVAIILRRS